MTERKGWAVAQVFIDNDVSAYSGKARPAYDAMLAAVEAREVDVIVVWHLDRLTRRPIELERIIEVLERTGATVATVTGGDYDLATSDGRAMARVVGVFARKESEDKSRRQRRKHLELAEKGAAVGGGRPFGFEVDRVTVREEEAALIREAVERVLAGESVRGICMDWGQRGVRGPRGGRWTQTSMRRILRSGRIAGLRTMGRDGPVVAKAVWPAIIDEATWRQVRTALDAAASTYTGSYAARTYLLTGLAVCGLCGTRLIARARTERRRNYVCTSNPDKGGCGRIRVVAEPMELEVVRRVVHRVDSPIYAAAVERLRGGASIDVDAVAAAIAADEAALEQLARDHYADRVIARGEYLAAREPIERRLAGLRARLVEDRRGSLAGSLVGGGEALGGGWDGLALERRRAIVRALVEAVVVGPATPGLGRFEKGRVSIRWRL